MPSDKSVDRNLSWLLAAVGLASAGIALFVAQVGPTAMSSIVKSTQEPVGTVRADTTSTAAATASEWAASAPGRVEPKGGLINVGPEASGQIVAVHAAENDQVKAGDLLIVLKDDEQRTRITAAQAEVAVRLGERDEPPEEGEQVNPLELERRAAADALAAAERSVHRKRMAFDTVFLRRRAGSATDAEVEEARRAIDRAVADVASKLAALEEVKAKPGMPLPTRLDSGLTLARTDLRLAEIALENTRVRAPVDGRVLRLEAKVGETASPTQPVSTAVIGNMRSMQVLAEVQERDVSRIRIGQEVVVRSNAFEGLDFTGRVSSIAPSLGSPGIRAQGPRKQLDVEVLEVMIDLQGTPKLLPGMRVDVFFRSGQRVSSAKK